MKTQELLIEARKNVDQIAKATKTLIFNDAYTVCFIEKTDGSTGIKKIQKGWRTNKTCIKIGNQPMTKKEVIAVLDQVEYELNSI